MCKPYGFVKHGQFVNGVDRYFNMDDKKNIWLYYNFISYSGGEEGLRMDSLFPSDKLVLQSIGLKGRSTKVYFTAVPSKQQDSYHMLFLKHRLNRLEYLDYKEVRRLNELFYFKDFQHDSLRIRHVVIPVDKKKTVSFVFYANNSLWRDQTQKYVDYLSSINAQGIQSKEPYDPSWQIYDCPEETSISKHIQIDKEVLRKYKQVYFQLFAIYEQDLGLLYTKFLKKGRDTVLDLKLCPNVYQLRYTTLSGKLVKQDTLRISN